MILKEGTFIHDQLLKIFAAYYRNEVQRILRLKPKDKDENLKHLQNFSAFLASFDIKYVKN